MTLTMTQEKKRKIIYDSGSDCYNSTIIIGGGGGVGGGGGGGNGGGNGEENNKYKYNQNIEINNKEEEANYVNRMMIM